MQTPSKTRERSTLISPIVGFTVGIESPDGQGLNIDTIYEKLKIQSFKYNILQTVRKNISEIFDAELVRKSHVLITTYNRSTTR